MGSGYMDMIVPNVTNPLWPTQLYIIIGHVLEVFAFVDQHKPIVSVQRSFYGIAVVEIINSSIKIRLIIMIIDLQGMYLTGFKQINLQKLAFVCALGYPKTSNIFIIGVCSFVFAKAGGGFDGLLVGKQHPAGKLSGLVTLHGSIPRIIPKIRI